MGGVVQRCLQQESGGGVEREVSGSSSNDKHLSVIAVIGVGRVCKRPSWTLHLRESGACVQTPGAGKLWKE